MNLNNKNENTIHPWKFFMEVFYFMNLFTEVFDFLDL